MLVSRQVTAEISETRGQSAELRHQQECQRHRQQQHGKPETILGPEESEAVVMKSDVPIVCRTPETSTDTIGQFIKIWRRPFPPTLSFEDLSPRHFKRILLILWFNVTTVLVDDNA